MHDILTRLESRLADGALLTASMLPDGRYLVTLRNERHDRDGMATGRYLDHAIDAALADFARGSQLTPPPECAW